MYPRVSPPRLACHKSRAGVLWRVVTGLFRRFTYEKHAAQDQLNLDIFWLEVDSLKGLGRPPKPDMIAEEIVENLEAALEHFRGVHEELS